MAWLRHFVDWLKGLPAESTHDNFKIIVDGKELEYPWMRIIASWACCVMIGFVLRGML